MDEEMKECRLCARFVNMSDLKELFVPDAQHWLKKLKRLTAIRVTAIAGLPDHACGQCINELENAHEFLNRCLKSRKYFLSSKYSEERQQRQKRIKSQKEEAVERVASTGELVEPTEEATVVVAKVADNNDGEDEFSPLEYSEDEDNPSVAIEYVDCAGGGGKLPKSPSKKPNSNPSKPAVKGDGYVCRLCSRVLKNHHTFRTHMMRHAGDRRFRCNICQKAFYTRQEVKLHQVVHTGDKPYACTYCHRPFSTRSACVLHERNHTNELPYLCTICGERFMEKQKLQRHFLDHTNERPFECTLCNLGFKDNHGLAKHKKCNRHARKLQQQQELTECHYDDDAADDDDEDPNNQVF